MNNSTTICCDLDLPFHKKGDDVCWRLDKGMNPASAFEDYAETLRAAAKQLKAVARHIKDYPDVEVDAQTHSIRITGPEAVLKPLIAAGYLAPDDWEETKRKTPAMTAMCLSSHRVRPKQAVD